MTNDVNEANAGRRPAPTPHPNGSADVLDPADDDSTDVVISEGREGWTIRLSPRLLGLLGESRDVVSDDQPVTVLLRPNLVPGDVFSAHLRT